MNKIYIRYKKYLTIEEEIYYYEGKKNPFVGIWDDQKKILTRHEKLTCEGNDGQKRIL